LTPYERRKTHAYVKAFCGLYGSLVFWVGAWNLVDASRHTGGLIVAGTPLLHEADDDVSYYGPELPRRECIYAVVGLLTILLTDTLYANATLEGNYFRQVPNSHLTTTVRVVLGMCGTLLFWNGLNDLQWHVWFNRSVSADVLFILCGLAILIITDTFWGIAYIESVRKDNTGDDEDDDLEMGDWGEGGEGEEMHTGGDQEGECMSKDVDGEEDGKDGVLSHKSSIQQHFRQTVMAIVSIMGQNSLWVGAFDLLEGKYPASSPNPPISMRVWCTAPCGLIHPSGGRCFMSCVDW
jgi:hypothetical protein